MKKVLNISVFLVSIFYLLTLSSCKKDVDKKEWDGDINFAFQTKEKLKSKQDAKFIVVSIKNANNEFVFENKIIELFQFNGAFISKSISLPIGNYTLEDFLVSDAAGNIIYVAPKQSEKFEYLVDLPLSIPFVVTKDAVTKLTPEVLSTDCFCSSTDFGYNSFDFNIVDALCILTNVQVFDAATANWIVTDASITINGDNDVQLFVGTVPATTDSIKVLDGSAVYKLTFSKDGFNTKVISLTIDEIKEYATKPLTVTLSPISMIDFLLLVQIQNLSTLEWETTSSTILVKADNVEVMNKPLNAVANLLSVPATAANYEFTLSRNNSETLVFTLSNSELKQYNTVAYLAKLLPKLFHVNVNVNEYQSTSGWFSSSSNLQLLADGLEVYNGIVGGAVLDILEGAANYKFLFSKQGFETVEMNYTNDQMKSLNQIDINLEKMKTMVDVLIPSPQNGMIYTDVNIIINASGNELFNGQVTTTNKEVVFSDGYSDYEFIISKSGYVTKTETKTNDELKQLLSSGLIFQLEPTKINFNIDVQIYNFANSSWESTTALIQLSENNQLLFDEILTSPTAASVIEKTENYTLDVSKDGFESFTQVLTPQELADYSSSPLVVRLNDLKINFLIDVKIYDASSLSWVVSDAILVVKANGGTLLDEAVSSSANSFSIPDWDTDYELTITKSGYDTKVITLTRAEFQQYTSSPLVVSLTSYFDVNLDLRIYDAITGNYVGTTGDVIIKANGEELFNGSVVSTNQNINLKEGFTNYEFSISKTGYETQVLNFTNAELKNSLITPIQINYQSKINFYVDIQSFAASVWSNTSGTLLLKGDGVQLYNGNVASKTQMLTVKEEVMNFELIFSKTGFATKTVNLSNAQLKQHISSTNPVIARLFETPKDGDGNVYNTVQIGNQMWLASNLKTTKYNDGTSIPEAQNGQVGTTPVYSWLSYSVGNKDAYGGFYSWYVVDAASNGNKNVCPVGFHAPTDAEWTIMEDYLIANGYNYNGTTSGNNIGKAVANTSGWSVSSTTGAIGNTDYPSYQNKSGFSVVASGYRNITDGSHVAKNTHAYFWTSTPNGSNAWYRTMNYNSASTYSNSSSKSHGLSVRCIKN